MKLSEKIQEALREQQEINLSDPAVQKRLAAQWGYVPAGAQPAPSMASGDVSLISEGKTQPAPSAPDGWKLVPTAESRHPAIYRMLAALHIADRTAGLSEWDSYRAMLAEAPEAKP